jgi:hypothetical protein
MYQVNVVEKRRQYGLSRKKTMSANPNLYPEDAELVQLQERLADAKRARMQREELRLQQVQEDLAAKRAEDERKISEHKLYIEKINAEADERARLQAEESERQRQVELQKERELEARLEKERTDVEAQRLHELKIKQLQEQIESEEQETTRLTREILKKDATPTSVPPPISTADAPTGRALLFNRLGIVDRTDATERNGFEGHQTEAAASGIPFQPAPWSGTTLKPVIKEEPFVQLQEPAEIVVLTPEEQALVDASNELNRLQQEEQNRIETEAAREKEIEERHRARKVAAEEARATEERAQAAARRRAEIAVADAERKLKELKAKQDAETAQNISSGEWDSEAEYLNRRIRRLKAEQATASATPGVSHTESVDQSEDILRDKAA